MGKNENSMTTSVAAVSEFSVDEDTKRTDLYSNSAVMKKIKLMTAPLNLTKTVATPTILDKAQPIY